MAQSMFQVHPIPPLYDADSKILILGSFPSVKSREGQFFYHHPQNRFWKVLAAVLNEPQPETIEEKRAMLLKHHIALWDVIGSCEIAASDDNSIRNVVPNDLSPILHTAKIRAIFCNGTASYNNYVRYLQHAVAMEAMKLPSTSPANATWKLPRLIDAWQVIIPHL